MKELEGDVLDEVVDVLDEVDVDEVEVVEVDVEELVVEVDVLVEGDVLVEDEVVELEPPTVPLGWFK